MYEMKTESHVMAKRPLLAFDPYATTMTPIVNLAKAADVGFYPGYSAGPMFIEEPEHEQDRVALDEMAKELGLVRWTGRIA
jgi:hypothetical protein